MGDGCVALTELDLRVPKKPKRYMQICTRSRRCAPDEALRHPRRTNEKREKKVQRGKPEKSNLENETAKGGGKVVSAEGTRAHPAAQRGDSRGEFQSRVAPPE